MSLADVVRNAVSIADSVTKSLQATVTHKAWTGPGALAGPTYATAVSYQALVEYKQSRRRKADGTEVLSRAYVAFLQPVAANGASDRKEPIDPRDVITLPDGTTGPILDIDGLVDPDTTRPYYSQVWLG